MPALFHVKGTPIGPVSVMLALLASMGGFMFGYDTGQISDIQRMPDFLLRFSTCDSSATLSTATSLCSFNVWRSGLIVSLLSIGTLAGALAGAPTADFLGRRRAMTVECCLFLVGLVTQITSMHVWQQYAVGRLISGLAIGALSAAVPMYQAETAPQQIRGTLTATYQLFITFGILTAYCISIGTREIQNSGSWRAVNGVGATWPTILGLGILFMPESPRWLATRGKYDQAHISIARTHGIPTSEALSHPLVIRQVQEIRTNIEYERKILEKADIESGSSSSTSSNVDPPHQNKNKIQNPLVSSISAWIDCFRPSGKTLYRTLLGMALQSFQQLTGANYFFYYGATIFDSVGIADSFITQIILGAVNFGCTFGGLYVMEKFGRRVPLIVGGVWNSAWLFVFAAAGTAKDPHEDPGVGKVMICAACLFILGYATTWAPGVWILVGETFPTRTRARQGALSTASNWLWNFLLALFTPLIVNEIQFRYGFVFAACNLTGAIIVYFFLYESSNLSLENVDLMYNDPNCKPWNSDKWAPEGYKDRRELIESVKDMGVDDNGQGDMEKYRVEDVHAHHHSEAGKSASSS